MRYFRSQLPPLAHAPLASRMLCRCCGRFRCAEFRTVVVGRRQYDVCAQCTDDRERIYAWKTGFIDHPRSSPSSSSSSASPPTRAYTYVDASAMSPIRPLPLYRRRRPQSPLGVFVGRRASSSFLLLERQRPVASPPRIASSGVDPLTAFILDNGEPSGVTSRCRPIDAAEAQQQRRRRMTR